MNPKAPNPYLVLAAAILFPGTGHLLLGRSDRALKFLFFMIVLGWVSYRLTTPAHSFVGRYAFGIFVYAISIVDSFSAARLRDRMRRKGTAEDFKAVP